MRLQITCADASGDPAAAIVAILIRSQGSKSNGLMCQFFSAAR